MPSDRIQVQAAIVLAQDQASLANLLFEFGKSTPSANPANKLKQAAAITEPQLKCGSGALVVAAPPAVVINTPAKTLKTAIHW